MNQETIDKYHKAKALIDGGMGKVKAYREVNMSCDSYNKCDRELGKKVSKKTILRKKATFIDLPPVKSQSTNVAVVVCDASQLKSVLAGLQ